ncbi:MAG TPA: DedA family protein [Bacteroidia bacterium]|nr:DedA family protein [Bacteroidia bacterium]
MEALPKLAAYLSEYGYYAIFILVFLQGLGIPNPITNELVLIFCGYLSYTGTLNFYKVIITAISADFIGTSILFFIFYSFSKWLIAHSPKWLPLNGETIEKLKKRLLRRGNRSVFIGRLTPFLRGYVSVAAGMLHVNRKAFLGTVIISAVTWSGGLVLLGRLIGPYWNTMLKESGVIGNVLLIVTVIIVIMFIGRYFQRRQLNEEK